MNYNYDGRYLFELNIRHDGSSRMPKAHRYATFPSVSGAWILTNESFMENVEPLSYFKLRASWGKLGNQEIGNYAFSATMAANYNYYFGNDKVIGMAENIVANDNIRWETTTITDIGFDVAFWRNRIDMTFDYFNKETSDILLQLSMPSTFWQGVSGIYRYNWEQTSISNGGNMTTRWLDRWSETNPAGSMPRMGNSFNDSYSSFWLDKSDYFRLKNIELGYTINKNLLRKAGIDYLRIYVQATNPFTITKLKNYDPEKSSGDTRGDVHPNVKSYSLGLNVKF